MKTFTQTTEQLKEINFLNNAYKCFFTAEEIDQIKNDWAMSEIQVCECCRKEVNEAKVWSEICSDNDHQMPDMCGECNEELIRDYLTFEEYVAIDSKNSRECRQLLGQ